MKQRCHKIAAAVLACTAAACEPEVPPGFDAGTAGPVGNSNENFEQCVAALAPN